jgi:uncharacterized repeat protein (TIGR04138 family)
MQSLKFDEVLTTIVERDPRYHRDAYLFMREALDYTQKTIGTPKRNEARHVTGGELLEGIRKYALEQFGPMTPTVLDEWGVRCCEDFGELVFLMVEHNLLAKTERDSRDDFKGGYTFFEAFELPFLPEAKRRAAQKKSVQV